MNIQSTSKQWEKEYIAGLNSGLLHDSTLLCRENLYKLEKGINSLVPLIRAYWLGYQDGLKMIASKAVNA